MGRGAEDEHRYSPEVGARFGRDRVLGAEVAADFAARTGDTNPLHHDPELDPEFQPGPGVPAGRALLTERL